MIYKKKYRNRREADNGRRKPKEEDKFPEPDEVRALLNAVEKHGSARDYMIIYITVNFGLRSIELIRLKKDSFDFKRGTISILTAKTKEEDPTDRLGIPAKIVTKIQRYINSLDKDNDYIFPSRKGKNNHITTRTVRYVFDYYAGTAGIRRRLSFHCLRHYRGLMIWRKTKDIMKVAALLRHRSVKSSWTYTHITMEDKKKLAEEIPIIE